MTAIIDYKLTVWSAGEVFERILSGRLGLPDFQRRFEWSNSDVKALLSTVLGGLPSGSIMVTDNEYLRVALRELEGAPPLRDGLEALALLDGQQRLTALFQAVMDVGPDQYFVNFSALADGASVLEDDVILSGRRGRPPARAAARDTVVPLSALQNDHRFFAWLHENASAQSPAWGRIFAEQLHAIDRYPIPVTALGGDLDLSTVAQIFERTNKWGQRLDAFDLLVARLQSGGWSLRSAWESATQTFPSISRVLGDNGLPVVAAISLRVVADVRRNAVLSLPPGKIEGDWKAALEATNDVAGLLLREGVRKPELLAYDSLMTTMIASRMEGTSAELLMRYYWLGAMNRWHESASNTKVVSDFKHLSQGRLDPLMPQGLPPAEELSATTRRSSRALWCSILSALLTVEPRDLVTGEPVTSAQAEAEDTWHLVPLVTGGRSTETSEDVPARLRAAAQVFASAGPGTRIRRLGVLRTLQERMEQPSLFHRPIEEDMRSQLLPDHPEELQNMAPRQIVTARAHLIRQVVESRLAGA